MLSPQSRGQVAGNGILYSATGGDSRDSLAATNLTTGKTIDWHPHPNRYVDVGAMAIAGGKMLLVGAFARSLG